MTDDLVKRLRDTGEGDMYLAPYTTKVLIDTAADRIEHLEAALKKMLTKCTWAKREQWCGCIDCNCVIARAALGEKKDD